MCDKCFPTNYIQKNINNFGCKCGCVGTRRFLILDEKKQILDDYKKQLENEILGIEKAIKELE